MKMKIAFCFLFTFLLLLVFLPKGSSSTIFEQKNDWAFNTSTRDTIPPQLTGSSTGYNLSTGQVLSVTWNANGNSNQQNPASSLRFYLLNSTQIGGWNWVRDPYGNQYEQTNLGYLIKLDSFATTVDCLINSTDTYYVILACEGTYGSAVGPPGIYVYSYVATLLNVVINPTNVTMEIGQTQSFNSTVTGGTPPYTYQWYLDQVAVSGATSSTWTLTSAPLGNHVINVNVNDSASLSTYSNNASVYVQLPPSVAVSPSSLVMDVNQSQIFNSTVIHGTPPYIYQWYLNGTPIVGANSSSWTFRPSTQGSPIQIYLSIADNLGVQATSNTAAVTLNGALSASVSPNSPVIDMGQSQIFNSTVSGGTTPYSYQWYLSNSSVSQNVIANPGFETGNLTGWNQEGPYNAQVISQYHHTGHYSCATPYNASNSEYLPIRITQKLPSVPTILVTNVSCWYRYGSPYDFLRINYTDGSSTTVGFALSSSWSIVNLNLDPNKTVDSLIVERTTASSIIMLVDDVQFNTLNCSQVSSGASSWKFSPASPGLYTLFLNLGDGASNIVTSNVASATVNQQLNVSVSPTINQLYVNQSQLFSANVTGGSSSYTYQWYLNNALVPGADNSTWLFTPTTSDRYSLYVNISDSLGSQSTSNTMVIIVIEPGTTAPPFLSVEPTTVAPLTNINSSMNGLETPPTPSPIGQDFTVEIHLRNATLTNVHNGVASVEVYFDFTAISGWAEPTGFIQMIGQPAGVLSGPVLFSISPGFYLSDGVTQVTSPPYTGATQFIVAGAEANNLPWNAADGLIANVTFQIINQPPIGQPDFFCPLQITVGEIADPSTSPINSTISQGTLRIDAQPVPYTIDTNPVGLNITVDGTPFIAPQTFNWALGSNHTISTSSPQGSYAFANWTDNGIQTHQVTVGSSATTITAYFNQQVYLTVSIDPPGVTSISGQGFYVNGTVANLTAPMTVAVSESSQYRFNNWDVDGVDQGATSSISVLMDSNHTATAHYVLQYWVAFTQSGLSPDATGTIVSVNGTAQTYSNLPYSLWVDSGSIEIYYYEPIANSSTLGKQFFLTDINGEFSPITIGAPTTVTGNYKVQYYLAVISAYDSPSPPSGWFDSGSNVSASIASPVAGSTGTQYVCSGWTGAGSVPSSGGSLSTSFTISAPSTLTWNWNTQYYLAVSSSYDSPSPTSSWFDAGSIIAASITSPVLDPSGVRYVCTGWSGTGSVPSSGSTEATSFTINAPSSIAWNWKTQDNLTVLSTYGSPSPSSGWFDSGTLINALVTSPVAGPSGTQYICNGWIGTGSVPASGIGSSVSFVITNTSTITWNWELQITHDVAVANVTTSKAGGIPLPTVGRYQNITVNVTVADTGMANESSVNVTAYATANQSSIAIGTMTIPINAGTNATVSFVWNVTLPYGDYNFSAAAGPVPGETNIGDNMLSDGTVRVTIAGDLNGDYQVKLQDLVMLANGYGTSANARVVGSHRWNPNADIDNNGTVGLSDLVILAAHYGKSVKP